MFSFVVTFFAAFLLLNHRVQAHPASPLAVAVVTEQFKNAKIVPDILPAFNPIGLLTLNYTSRTTVGAALTTANTSTAPQAVYIRGTAESEAASGGPFNVTTYSYTVLMFDAGVPGAPSSLYSLHWLSNGWTYGQNDDHTVTLTPPSSSVVAYSGPNPDSGSGPHRYITLVYVQPSNFTPPDIPGYTGTGVPRFNLTTYRTNAGFGPAIVGTYFTIEQGTATVTYASTTEVDSMTLPQYTPTSTKTSPASIRVVNWSELGAFGMLLGLLLA